KETKEMLQLILNQVSSLGGRMSSLEEKVSNIEQGQQELRQDVKELQQGQQELKEEVKIIKDDIVSVKQHITDNNIAIAEIITNALEDTHEKVETIEEITKDNLYDITVLKRER
ncbi:MAG: hypothetical protein RSC41_00940, partial [Oscillospiraceae bacterium]